MARQFLVFDLPAEGTRLGPILATAPGCRLDLVGRPLIRDEGHAYLLHYLATGIDADTRLRLLREMMGTHDEVETVDWDPASGVWEVRAIVAMDRIGHHGFRFVAGLFGLTQAPWVLFEGTTVSVRLYPREPQLMPSLAEAVDARLAQLGVPARPRVEALDMAEYRERARCVGVTVAT